MFIVNISVFGLVQGVGFRPFVAEAARELSVSGTVRNAGGIVLIRAASVDRRALDELIRRLSSCTVPGARVDRVEVSEVMRADDEPDSKEMQIVESSVSDGPVRFLPADIATCANCARELKDKENRRYRYPFISCVSCGPRFSIMHAVPYDRERTTMAGFSLCEKCQADYVRFGDIRRHAQTIACGTCGPSLHLFSERPYAAGQGASDNSPGYDPVREAADRIGEGWILAIKGIGGYHFAFDPYNEEAAKRLREYKNREAKPLAVMFPDCESIRRVCHMSDAEEQLLVSPAGPIVLLDKLDGTDPVFAPSVCGESRQIGAMLPSHPIQIMLAEACGPLVMTSGNRGGEPIVTQDEVMTEACRQGFPDAVLSHDREIVVGLDDSVCQVIPRPDRESVQFLRRARGYVPEPVELPLSFETDTLAAGGDLKSVCALGSGHLAYLTGQFGDLADVRVQRAREEGIRHLSELLRVHPKQTVCDSHPGYISFDRDARKISHHVAHVLSVAAEHGLSMPFAGLAFDGTGYGDDGTIWGSEMIVCEKDGYRRAGHFSVIPMIGSDAASRDARMSLAAFFTEAMRRGLLTQKETDEYYELRERAANVRNASERSVLTHIRAAVEGEINTVRSSSMGRLFDAVAALLGIASVSTYEGECAVRLQIAAENWAEANGVHEQGYIPSASCDSSIWAPVKTVSGVHTADSVFLFAGLVKRLLYGEDPGELAYAFHIAVADAAAELCMKEEYEQIALSGGTMCNRLLLGRLMRILSEKGRKVFINEKVPCGDGGLALGQLMGVLSGYDRVIPYDLKTLQEAFFCSETMRQTLKQCLRYCELAGIDPAEILDRMRLEGSFPCSDKKSGKQALQRFRDTLTEETLTVRPDSTVAEPGPAAERRAGFCAVYVEEEIRDHERVRRILEHFSGLPVQTVSDYRDVFYHGEGRGRALILAKKKGPSLRPGAAVCQDFDERYFYYTSCATGCLYHCEYCYLKGMYPSSDLLIYVNPESIFTEIEEVLTQHEAYVCISYDTDLFALEGLLGYVRLWTDFVREHDNLLVECRTKCDGTKLWKEMVPCERMIVAYTISPDEVISRFEHGTPRLNTRLESVRAAMEAGFPVRLCFDPMVAVPGWKKAYEEMVHQVADAVELSRIRDISVGSFRISGEYIRRLRKVMPESFLVQYPFVCRDGVYGYPEKLSGEMTCMMINMLSKWVALDRIFTDR